MNQRKFLRQLTKAGCVFLRSWSKHDIYLNPATGQKQPVSRHKEIDDNLVKHIRKYLGFD